jgi:hypothetical protein
MFANCQNIYLCNFYSLPSTTIPHNNPLLTYFQPIITTPNHKPRPAIAPPCPFNRSTATLSPPPIQQPNEQLTPFLLTAGLPSFLYNSLTHNRQSLSKSILFLYEKIQAKTPTVSPNPPYGPFLPHSVNPFPGVHKVVAFDLPGHLAGFEDAVVNGL